MHFARARYARVEQVDQLFGAISELGSADWVILKYCVASRFDGATIDSLDLTNSFGLESAINVPQGACV